ncbi:MAG: hypothetical protein M5U26_21980 [Planctomycetota bacterium]|nr:hypothetical protein [Planctomycetota bacterium]
MRRTNRIMLALVAAWLALLTGPGCSTKAAKKALNKPYSEDTYAGFGDEKDESKSEKVRKAEPVTDDMDPEHAVSVLVDQLQRHELAYVIGAEDELHYWAQKQGVAEIIVRKVRLLLKSPRIEIRAPALRLIIAYGGRESLSDLIEVLADSEFGMRESAFKKLKVAAGRDFGFEPGGGELARVKSIELWRQWWQDEQRNLVASGVSGEGESGPAPHIVPPPPQVIRPEDDARPMLAPANEEPADQKKFYTPQEERILPRPRMPRRRRSEGDGRPVSK